MKRTFFVLAFFFVTVFSFAQEKTTYFLIRHAEKQRINPEDKDPQLTFNGYKRSDNWKKVLQHVKFDAVYSTDLQRTKLTAQPIAEASGLPILLYDPSKMYTESFKDNTAGKNVLIVGHSNTTPAFVNKILGEEKYQNIADDNNSNLYIVTVLDGKVVSTLLHIQ